MKEKLSKNTIAYCITAIICTLILSLAYLHAAKYEVSLNGQIIDKYNKTIEWPDSK